MKPSFTNCMKKNKKKQIFVDGIIYKYQKEGGISRIFDNLLPQICDHDQDLEIKIIYHGKIVKPLPSHKQITSINISNIYPTIGKYFRPWRLWHWFYPTLYNTYIKLLFRNSRNKVWISTYFTKAIVKWHGKTITFVYDMIYEKFPDLLPDADVVVTNKKNSIQSADVVICISKTTVFDFLSYYPEFEGKVFPVYLSSNEIFKVRTADQLKYRIPFQFILFVGKRGYYKNFTRLVSAYCNWSRRAAYKLVVVGPQWEQEELENLISKKLLDEVLLLSNITDDQLCDIYNQAAAFVYPSTYEGFGIPLIEAMACGCPIIASRISSTLEVAKDVPFYFDPENVGSLIDALDEAVNKGHERLADGKLLASTYSWDKTAQEFLDILHKVTDV